MVAYGIAEDNLALGNTVVADSVNCLKITRDAWLSVAARSSVPSVEIEIICSDKNEHRRRAETRATDVQGLRKPTWEEIMTRHYDDWGHGPLVVDTAAQEIGQLVAKLMSTLALSKSQPRRDF